MIKILDYAKHDKEKIFARVENKIDVEKIVSEIIFNVRKFGDKALYEYGEKFDKVKLDSLKVTKEEIDYALSVVDKDFLQVVKDAAKNIQEFHSKQVRQGFEIKRENGEILGQKILPIERAGLFVPGGTAAYPSTVLMDAIPAKIAGVKELIMVTPPRKDGSITPEILAAAYIAGVDTIYKVGGAGAIAALAYGTETIKKVDKIVGPGNMFVAEAKRQVYGMVSIDMIAGPSEILIVADNTCNAKFVAADLLSQAEHDKMASAVLITNDFDFAKEVAKEIEVQLESLERSEIARASIENNGKIIVAKNLEVAIDIANSIAPEHLEICLDNPFDYLDKIKHAGSVFLGKYTPEALGDYFAGANHTLPTMGSARFSSALSVDDFIKKTQYIYYPKNAFDKVADSIDLFAKKEGLTAHGKSATVRK